MTLAMSRTCVASNSEEQVASLSDNSCLLEVSDKLLSLSCFIVAATSAPAAEESFCEEQGQKLCEQQGELQSHLRADYDRV